MKHLVVVCHPRRKSFTQTIARAYVQEVTALGHDAVVRDLYGLRFNPVLGERELMGANFPVIPEAARREQRHIAAAGAIAFFFPLWWAFMPAMLKGYFDRVFTEGFAYDLRGDDLIPRLSGKNALIFTSSASDMDTLRDSGQWDIIRAIERDHMLSLVGIELLEHVNFPSITPDLGARDIDRHVRRLRRTVRKHWGGFPATRG
jgi:NAD(P)H dehydrogenase (quinone)